MWEIRQTNFMGGYDTVARLPWRWLARLFTTRRKGYAGEGCTAGCTYVAKEEAEK